MAEPTKEELAQWLDEAADLIGDWGAYAGDYFQKKWDLDGDIQKFRERAAAARGVEGRPVPNFKCLYCGWVGPVNPGDPACGNSRCVEPYPGRPAPGVEGTSNG